MLLNIALLCILLLVALIWLMGRKRRALGFLPGPPAIPVLGNIHQLESERAQLDFAKQYGKIYLLSLMSNPVVMVSDAIAARRLLTAKEDQILRGEYTYKYDRIVFGNSLVTVDGVEWKTRRSRLNPHFRATKLNELLPFANDTATLAVKFMTQQSLQKSAEFFDIDKVFSALTLDVILNFLLGVPAAENVSELIETNGKDSFWMDYFQRACIRLMVYSLAPWWQHVPLKSERDYHRMRTQYFERIRSLLRDMQKERPEAGNVSSTLIDASVDEGDIVEELGGLIFAGHDTTAHSLSFALYEVLRSDSIRKRLLAEIDEFIPGQPCLESPICASNPSTLAKMPYLNAVIKETLRLYPAAVSHPCETQVEYQVGQYKLPKGTTIFVDTWTIHRLTEYWGPDAEEFRPERFLEPKRDAEIVDGIASFESNQAENANEKPLTYFPFLYGGHSCIGQHLALLELRTVLSLLLKNFEFEIKTGYKFKASPMPTLKPAEGLPVRLSLRKDI